jgi:pyruvate dehydrogenase E1 component alpha subunit
MDPVAVAKTMDKAIGLARKGGGPSFIEMKTYRYRGHSMSDAQHYRTKDEVEEYRKIDPITQVKEIILSKKFATQKQLDEVDASVKERVKECEKFAESSPYPDKSLMYDAVYEQKEYPFIKHKL